MVLIILSWIYILLTTINFGFYFDKIFCLKNKNFIITSILGLFSITVFGSIWAIFGRINIEFHVILLLFNLFVIIRFKSDILSIYKTHSKELNQLPTELKAYLSIITVMIIAQCSLLPYIIDNESYYIQTIKWINEYGFVKGIANLHLFLGQASGWHVTQSIFNFSFLYPNFNDISGFCLLLGVFFSIQKLNEFYINKKLTYLTIGFFPIASIYFFQFISAPSPDIPVYVFTFIILFYFLENYKKCEVEVFNLIIILTLFTIYIKSTSVILVLIPIILLIINFKITYKYLAKSIALSILIFLLFIIKNTIISGSPFFPSKIFEFIKIDYAVPEAIENFYYNELKNFGYLVNLEQYKTLSKYELFIRWLTLPKLTGLFNKITFFLILATPFFIYKFQNKIKYWLVYVLMTLQLLLLLATSPQYRFFMNFTLFYGIFGFVCLFRTKKIIISSLVIGLLPILLTLFVPIPLSGFTNNKFMAYNSHFTMKEILFPAKNSKNNTGFELIKIGNFKYNSPIKNDFFWGTGNGNLPCVNKDQVEYYQKYFRVIPQMRTNDLKDGFYAKQISSDD